MAAKTTYELEASKQIKVGSGVVCALTVVTNGAANARVLLYDVSTSGDAATANKITDLTIKAANFYGGRTWVEPVMFSEGLYAVVAGDGASYMVEWRN